MDVPPNGVRIGADGVARCWWCNGDGLYETYHDREWGRPVADDDLLFEKLCLEGFQAGLSWLTILRKRENFRRAFEAFEIEAVARFDARDVDRLLSDPGIVRHRGKIESTINNARRCTELIEEAGSLAAYVWSFAPTTSAERTPLDWTSLAGAGPSVEATRMSKDLKRRGWSFVGPTTVYAFMEAMGLVNDHMTACELRDEVEQAREAFRPPTRATGRVIASRDRS